MTRTITDVESDLRKLEQFEQKTQAEIVQLERDLSVEGKSHLDEEFSGSGKVLSYEVLIGLRSSVESKKTVLAGVLPKRNELQRELVELQRLALITPWKAIEAETWRRYSNLAKNITNLQAEANGLLPMVQANSALAEKISQDAGIEWGLLQSLLVNIAPDLVKWRQAMTALEERRRKL